MSSKDLPMWMRHFHGDVPDPTPEEIAADREWTERVVDKKMNGIPLTPEEQAKDDAMFEAIMDFYGGGDPKYERIDWQQVFVFTARSMAAAAVAYLAFQFARYFQYFGVGALAMSGQFAISLFFLAVILNHTDGLRILTAALGLFLLVNSF